MLIARLRVVVRHFDEGLVGVGRDEGLNLGPSIGHLDKCFLGAVGFALHGGKARPQSGHQGGTRIHIASIGPSPLRAGRVTAKKIPAVFLGVDAGTRTPDPFITSGARTLQRTRRRGGGNNGSHRYSSSTLP